MDIQTQDGILLKNIPDGTPDDVIKARIAKIRSGPDSAVPDESLLANAGGMLRDLALGGLKGASRIGGAILNPLDPKARADRAATVDRFMNDRGADRDSFAYGAGDLGTQIAGTAGIGGALGLGAKAVGATRLGEAMTSGGMTTGATVAKGFAPAAADIGLRAAGGATVGGAAAGLVEPENAGAGAGIGAVAPFAIQAAGKSAGWLYDALRGRLGDLKAAQIYRDIIGSDANAARAANAAAPDTITAAQAAANAGVVNDPLQALGEMAKRNDKSTYFRPVLDAQDAEANAIRQRIAGGTNQTEAITTRIGDKKAVNAQFVPRMDIELNAVNEGQRLFPLQAQADALGGAAANKVQDVRRMTAAASRAEDMGTEFGRRVANKAVSPNMDSVVYNPSRTPNPSVATGMPSAGKRYSYGQELADHAESEATKAAGDSLILGEGRRFSQGLADSLAAHGIKPLDVNPILSGLSRKLSDHSAAGNKKYEAVLDRVGADMQEWAAKNGGVIDARALFGIRKNSVNDAVETLTAGLDPKASAKYAAQALADVRPMIDKAIVEAGGTNWPTTLKIFEKGMIPIERKEMGAKLLEMSKAKFAATIGGDNPKAVRKIFGPSSYDIGAEMGGKMRDLNKVADQYGRDAEMLRQAVAGQGGLGNIINRDVVEFRLPTLLNAKATALNKALDLMQGKINQGALDRLVVAQRSGKNANQLLDMLPYRQQKNFLSALLEGDLGNSAMIGGAGAVAASGMGQ